MRHSPLSWATALLAVSVGSLDALRDGTATEVTTGRPREVRYAMAVKDANDTSVYETQSGSKIIIGRAARARADLISAHRQQNNNNNNNNNGKNNNGTSASLENRQRQGRIVNNAVSVGPESRIVNDPEAYAHIPPFGGAGSSSSGGSYHPVEQSIRKDDVYHLLSQGGGVGAGSHHHAAKKAFDVVNAIDGSYRPVEKPIYDERVLNRPQGASFVAQHAGVGGLPSLGPIPPAVQDECICVPHYQCGRDGYLGGAGLQADTSSNSAVNVGSSYPSDFGPAQPPPPRRLDHVGHHHDQSFLDIDERSNDDDDDATGADDEHFGRQIEGRSGGNRRAKSKKVLAEDSSDGKTVKATGGTSPKRPKRELPSLNEKFIGEMKDDEANSTKGEGLVESRREEAPAYATEIMQRMLGVNFGNCGVLKTCCRLPPTFNRNSLPAGSFAVKAVAFAPDRRPTNSFNDFGNKPGFGKQDYPQAFVPPSGADFSAAYPPIGALRPQHPYPTCGARNSYGVRGRVANLNYPESGTDFAEFPWHVGIMKRLGPQESLYVCGGVLIASQWIATAAHCLKNLRPQELKVRLGEWDVHREDEFYAHVEKLVTDVVIHPEFFPGNLNNDVALLRMDGPVDLNSPHIAAACLPELPESFVGQRCWVTGWGKDAFGPQGAYQHVLRKVDVPLLDPLDCQDRLRRTRLGPHFKLHTSFVCAGGEPGKDACTGDGGSPMVCEHQGVWKVVGLVSWGIGCGTPGVPGVYVNMAKFRPWVENVLASASIASK